MRRQIDEAFPTDGTTSDDGVRVAVSNFGQNSTVVLATRQGRVHTAQHCKLFGLWGGVAFEQFLQTARLFDSIANGKDTIAAYVHMHAFADASIGTTSHGRFGSDRCPY